ncbi:MAG: hypothetical protein WCS27_15015, partial [Victivallaceae bacterium]
QYIEKIIETPEEVDRINVTVYPALFYGNTSVWIDGIQLVDLGLAKAELFVPKVTQAPVLDGQIRKGEWDSSAKSGRFMRLGEKQLASESTQAFMMRDDENLYVAFRCNESQLNKLQATHRERNSKIWEDDSVEFFICTGKELLNPRQFIVNSIGTCWDTLEGRENSWKARAYVGADFWSVEMAIPFSYLEIKPEAGMMFRGQFCRGEKPNRENSAWPAISSGSFNDLANSARIVLGSYRMVGQREITELLKKTEGLKVPEALAGEKVDILAQARKLATAIDDKSEFSFKELCGVRRKIADIQKRETVLEVKTVRERMPSKPTEKKYLTPELSRSDYRLPDAWKTRQIMGRDFWFDIKYMPDLWSKAGLENEPFIKDSLIRYNTWTPTEFEQTFFSKASPALQKTNRPFIVWGACGPMGLDSSLCRKFLEKYKNRLVCFTADECFGHSASGSAKKLGLPLPRTWREAFDVFKACYDDTKRISFRSWALTCPEFRSRTSCGTATYLDHWILEMGAPFTGQEIGATGYSMHLGMCFAFSRGAARQYGKPWRIYLAVWSSGVNGTSEMSYCNFRSPECRRYNIGTRWGWDTGPYSGSSLSLQKRQLYGAYMSGTNMVRDESDFRPLYVANYDWRNIAQVDPLVKVTRDKPYHLSPAGEIRKELYDNIVKKHDRGIAYTPAALLFDRYHGYISTYDKNKVLGMVPFTDADYMMRAVEATLFPTAVPLNLQSRATSPYGDMFDVLTNNARLETLQAYRALLLVGNVTLDKLFAKRLIDYVNSGGTLLINARQVKVGTLPEVFLGCKILKERGQGRIGYSLLDGTVIPEEKPFEYQRLELKTATPLLLCADAGGKKDVLAAVNKYGKGQVILTAPDYMKASRTQMLNMFKHLMAHTRDELLPIEWTGHVEVLVNRNRGSWVVTLINNEGVTKKGGQKEVIDNKKTADVHLLLKKSAGGSKVKAISEWVKGGNCKVVKTGKGTETQITVPAGNVRILEFKMD